MDIGSRPEPAELTSLYRQRFSERDLETKGVMWHVLVELVFQRYLPPDGTVCDLGDGNSELVNSLVVARRVAVDLNPDTSRSTAVGSGIASPIGCSRSGPVKKHG